MKGLGASGRFIFAAPAQHMKTAAEILRHGHEGVPAYMIRPWKGDFTNCPKTVFTYGGPCCGCKKKEG